MTDIISHTLNHYFVQVDVKKEERDILSKREEQERFREFMEDFNTATSGFLFSLFRFPSFEFRRFPSKKYYDIAAWYRFYPLISVACEITRLFLGMQKKSCEKRNERTRSDGK